MQNFDFWSAYNKVIVNKIKLRKIITLSIKIYFYIFNYK